MYKQRKLFENTRTPREHKPRCKIFRMTFWTALRRCQITTTKTVGYIKYLEMALANLIFGTLHEMEEPKNSKLADFFTNIIN